MRLINYRYSDLDQLSSFIDSDIPASCTIFIQLFSGKMDRPLIQMILDTLQVKLPDAIVIGTTTAGEIMDGVMSSDEIVIAFSLFDATDVKSRYFPVADFESGVVAAAEMVNRRSKVCIAFGEGLHGDSESFLNGFTSVCDSLVIAGGNVGDDLTFAHTAIMHGASIYECGIVLVVLESDCLQVHNNYSLNWTSIGKEMVVTHADKGVVYEIDGQSVKALHEHYLGKEAVSMLPESAIDFPLVKVVDGVRIARSLVGTTKDGGFIYAGHFEIGDKVRFAIGNFEEILNHAVDIRQAVSSKPTEATYIYSCSVRKHFLKEELNYELSLINEVAPTAGFFTYGEFFHSPRGNQLLNITTTTLSLSETEQIHSLTSLLEGHYTRRSMLKSLTQLVNVTQGELNDNIKMLDQYKMVLDESSIVSKTNKKGIITYVNDEFCKVSGFSREELIGKSHNIGRHPDNPKSLFKDLWKTIKAGKVWKSTFKNKTKDGGEYYVKSVIVPIFDDEGKIIEYISARKDVSELIKKEEIIQRQLKDPLTRLKNRTALFNDLESGGNEVTLMLVNIDRFSTINDYFGYQIGDELLKLFASRLVDTTLHSQLYRISGDEFAIICVDRAFDDELRDHAIDHINKLESFKYNIAGYDISINVSGGVAHATYTDVYNLAHMALKEAKELQEKLIFFNDNTALTEKTRNNIWMVNKIKSAIEEDRIIPYFQGIVDNSTRQIVKYEALIRLVESDGSVLSPYWFLEHAKKSKLYDRLTRIMIQKTFAVFEQNEFEFSLNLTVQDIVSDETREYLYQVLESSSAANRVIFEIVETEGIVNYEEMVDFIQSVKQFGCKIAIDDFGSGYSNFSYLSKLDVDFIKIDGSLIKHINQDDDHLFTVESILFFAHRKGIKTIAEFVEDESIYAKIVELGIDHSQGYLFSIPKATL